MGRACRQPLLRARAFFGAMHTCAKKLSVAVPRGGAATLHNAATQAAHKPFHE